MQLYLAAAPCCLGNAARWGLPLLHAAYGVEESRLTSLTLPAHVQGGLLLLTGPENPAVPQPDTLARDILRECLRRRYTGVVIEPQLPAAALSALAELCRREGIVQATGGGAVVRRENRRLLRDGGLVIFLDRSPWAIRRTLRRQGRPLLTDDGAIFRLARQRRDLYRATAHHSVNKSTARQAAEEAVRLWREEQT